MYPLGTLEPGHFIGLSRNLQGPAELKRDRLQDRRQGLACWQNRVSSSSAYLLVTPGTVRALLLTESGPTAGGFMVA